MSGGQEPRLTVTVSLSGLGVGNHTDSRVNKCLTQGEHPSVINGEG